LIVRKTAAELEKMRRSGLLVWQILQKLKEMAVEGVSTMDLEVTAEKMCRRPVKLSSLCCVPR
jgi:methionyl aminopeptidase